MSPYNSRTEPAYKNDPIPEYAYNRYILKWWNSECDNLILQEIKKWAWCWHWNIAEIITNHIPSNIIEKWKNRDPLCKKYAWYNIIMNFAIARAHNLGFLLEVRKSKWKKCKLCEELYNEDSLPYPFIQRFGINNLFFCSPCLSNIVLQNTGNKKSNKDEIINFLSSLAEALGRVPSQGFGEGKDDFLDLDSNELQRIMLVLHNKPSTKRIKKVFGSWLNALIKANILEDGTRKTARGTQTIAKDGHLCLSLGEKTIDDYLVSKGIKHKKEPHYPEGNYRADFLVDDIFIEYFGLKGDVEYDKKILLKQKLCKKHHIQLISIYPEDLMSLNKLEKKCSILFLKVIEGNPKKTK